MVQSLGEIGELQDLIPADQETPGEGAASAATPAEESVEEQDFKALYEQAAAKLEKQERDHRAQTIQRTTQMQRDASNALLEKTVLAIANKIFAGEVESSELPEVVKKGIASFTQEEAALADVATWVPAVQAKAQEIEAFCVQRGWTMDQAEMAEVKAAWNAGVAHGENNNPALAKALFDVATRSFELVKLRYPDKAQKSPVQSVNAGGGRAIGGGLSNQEFLNRYADEVNGGIPSTAENYKRAQALINMGLVAQTRKV